MAGIGLLDALEQAGAHALRVRESGETMVWPELHVLPVGIEVAVVLPGIGHEARLIGWDVIEHTTRNVLVSTIDELVAKLDAAALAEKAP